MVTQQVFQLIPFSPRGADEGSNRRQGSAGKTTRPIFSRALADME
jgi:hypothetical protein